MYSSRKRWGSTSVYVTQQKQNRALCQKTFLAQRGEQQPSYVKQSTSFKVEKLGELSAVGVGWGGGGGLKQN